jgi:hypothetical protein
MPGAACGMKNLTYVYTFDNIGDTTFTIDSYQVERTPPGTTANFSLNVTLAPNSIEVSILDAAPFDSCAPSTTTVTAGGIPGMCVDEDTYSYTEKGN